MDLTINQVIKAPVVSDKAYKLSKVGQIMCYVHVKSNAPVIKKAFEELFSVKVARVNTEIRMGKARRVKRIKVNGITTKIAYVTLAPGYTLDLFGKLVNEADASTVSQAA